MSGSPLTTEELAGRRDNRPLVVDLDGSLVRTDTLFECLVVLLSRPIKLARVLWALCRSKAAFKAALAEIAAPDPALLPYHRELLGYLRDEQQRGRPLILATGADRRVALAVARHLDLFDAVLASDGAVSLTGEAKLAAIRGALAGRDFIYVGDERRDLAVWREAAGAIIVGASPRLERVVAELAPIERSFPRSLPRHTALLHAMRPHQWVKNTLVFVPIVTARAMGDIHGWGEAALMFVAFSLAASGIYLVNDLCDLAADRLHAEKCRRPFASGALPIWVGLVVAPLLVFGGALFAAAAGSLPMLAVYVALSLGYSFFLKAQPLVDVFVLAALYAIRLIGGGLASGYPVSLWLLAFSSFLFLGLALAKRVAELQPLARREPRRTARPDAIGEGERKVVGRGYVAGDVRMLQLMGIAASFVTALVLALYVQSEAMPRGDQRLTLAWGIVPLILFWQCRVWLVTMRGEMHHDPIVFAARDWVSWALILTSFALLLFGGKVPLCAF